MELDSIGQSNNWKDRDRLGVVGGYIMHQMPSGELQSGIRCLQMFIQDDLLKNTLNISETTMDFKEGTS